MDNIEIALTRMLMSSNAAVVADACAVQCLRLVRTMNVQTAATDGVVLLYNPTFVADLTIPQCIGLLVHEMCHVRFNHTERFTDSGWLDRTVANISMDMEINPTVRDAGYELPPDCCWPKDIEADEHLSWEEYFTLYSQKQQQEQESQPSPLAVPSPSGSQPEGGGSGSDGKGETPAPEQPQAPGTEADAGPGESGTGDGPAAPENSPPGAGDSKPAPGEAGSGEPESGSSGPGSGPETTQPGEPGAGGQAGSGGPQEKSQGKPVEPGVHAPGSLTAEYAPDLLGGDFETPEELAEEVAQQISDFEDRSRVFDPSARTVVHQAGSGGSGQQKLGEAVLVKVSPDCRWQEVVIDMVATRAAGESVLDWSRPSRRSIASGYYQPSRRRVSGFKLALILDVSGSCVQFFDAWQAMAREMVEQVREITELEILYHDTQVTGQENWQRRTGEEVVIKSSGGGGTDFRSVMKLAESLDVDGAVLFTDSEGPFPDSFCLDCVTVQPPGSYVQTPFGTTIRLSAWE